MYNRDCTTMGVSYVDQPGLCYSLVEITVSHSEAPKNGRVEIRMTLLVKEQIAFFTITWISFHITRLNTQTSFTNRQQCTNEEELST